MSVNAKLPEFLNRAASRKFAWGEFDCGLWVADWYVFVTGKADPASHLRGGYFNQETCRRMCGPLGFPRMIQRIADSIPLKRTKDPLRGDIGIVRTRPGPIAVGAIKTKYGWAFLGTGMGISSINDKEDALHVLRSWRI